MAAVDLVWALAAGSYVPGIPEYHSAGSCPAKSCSVHSCSVHSCSVHSCSVHSCSAKNCTAALCFAKMSSDADTPPWPLAQGQLGQLRVGARGGLPPAGGAPLFRLPDMAPARTVAAAKGLFTVT